MKINGILINANAKKICKIIAAKICLMFMEDILFENGIAMQTSPLKPIIAWIILRAVMI